MKNHFPYLLVLLLAVLVSCSSGDSIGGDGNNQSTNGSTSRFAIYENYMFTLELNHLKIYNISDRLNPDFKREMPIDGNLETIFVYNKKLYIGAREGIFIINIDDPINAYLEGTITHWIARDPVVVREPYVFSTTRNNFWGQFNIYKKISPTNYGTVYSDALDQPLGLALASKHLYVCDISNGIVIYNIEDPENPNKITVLNEYKNPQDLIVLGQTMLVVAEKIFYLVDISNEAAPRIIRTIQ